MRQLVAEPVVEIPVAQCLPTWRGSLSYPAGLSSWEILLPCPIGGDPYRFKLLSRLAQSSRVRSPQLDRIPTFRPCHWPHQGLSHQCASYILFFVLLASSRVLQAFVLYYPFVFPPSRVCREIIKTTSYRAHFIRVSTLDHRKIHCHGLPCIRKWVQRNKKVCVCVKASSCTTENQLRSVIWFLLLFVLSVQYPFFRSQSSNLTNMNYCSCLHCSHRSQLVQYKINRISYAHSISRLHSTHFTTKLI